MHPETITLAILDINLNLDAVACDSLDDLMQVITNLSEIGASGDVIESRFHQVYIQSLKLL